MTVTHVYDVFSRLGQLSLSTPNQLCWYTLLYIPSSMAQTASLYRPAASLLRHQNFPSVVLYASACVSAKTFHDAHPAGSIGKSHHASIVSPCCYMITRLSCASPAARMPPLLLRSNTRPRASQSSVTFHCIGRCLPSSFAVITRHSSQALPSHTIRIREEGYRFFTIIA